MNIILKIVEKKKLKYSSLDFRNNVFGIQINMTARKYCVVFSFAIELKIFLKTYLAFVGLYMTSYFSIPLSDIFQDTLTVVGLINMTVMSPGAWLADIHPVGEHILLKHYYYI